MWRKCDHVTATLSGQVEGIESFVAMVTIQKDDARLFTSWFCMLYKMVKSSYELHAIEPTTLTARGAPSSIARERCFREYKSTGGIKFPVDVFPPFSACHFLHSFFPILCKDFCQFLDTWKSSFIHVPNSIWSEGWRFQKHSVACEEPVNLWLVETNSLW